MDSYEKFLGDKATTVPQQSEHVKCQWSSLRPYTASLKYYEEKMLGCYHNTYLKTDVSLLPDIFETFRNS